MFVHSRVDSSILPRNEAETGPRSWYTLDFLNRTSRVYFRQIFNRFSIHPEFPGSREFLLISRT